MKRNIYTTLNEFYDLYDYFMRLLMINGSLFLYFSVLSLKGFNDI